MHDKRKSRGLLLLSAFFIILFVSLGFWQITRGHEKNQLEAAYADMGQQEATPVTMPLESLNKWNHKNISVQGRYDDTKVFLLDNQVRDRQVGYNVISLFKLADGKSTILVDRGWIAAPPDRGQLPQISTQANSHELQGSVYVQSKPAFALGEIDEGEASDWPRRIQFINFAQLSKMAETTLQPFILRLSSNAPQGFRRDWLDNSFPASKHFGYAFQWFALAITVFILIIIFNRSQAHE